MRLLLEVVIAQWKQAASTDADVTPGSVYRACASDVAALIAVAKPDVADLVVEEKTTVTESASVI